MTDTNTKVREHYSVSGLTDRIRWALATIAPGGQTLTVVQLVLTECSRRIQPN
jgi:hypothetical protein